MRRLLLLLGVATILGVPAWAAAQESGRPALQEVVVTATKRKELLQDVPIADTVVSGEKLSQLNIVDTEELVQTVPSLILSGNPYGNFQQSWQIRGIGTQVNSPTLAQSVAVAVDGITVANSAMARMDFSDIERIEVLKGPQGTLFGRNASAGLVNIVTREPDLGKADFSSRVSYGNASDFNEELVQATGNVPLSDSVAARVSAYYHDRGGYLTNVLNGQKLNGYKDEGVRAKLLWRVTSNFSALLTGEYTKQADPYRQEIITGVVPGSPLALTLQQLGIVPGVDNRKVANIWPSTGRSYEDAAELRLDWELGDYTLTSTSGYRKYVLQDYSTDLANLPVRSLYGTIAGPMQQYSQELQLTSPSARTVEYVAGLFYDHFKFDSISQFGLEVPAFLCVPFTFGGVCAEQWHYVYTTESEAAYGQATVHLSDRLRLVAGGRLTHDSADFSYSNGLAPGFTSFAVLFPLVPSLYQTLSHTDFSWRAGPQLDLTRDVMVYATAAKGYKAGGFDSSGVQSATYDARVKPETSLDYEIGLKSSWLDRRLVANVDAYYTTFKDFQTQIAVNLNGHYIFRTQNAGGLRTQGFGADLTALPVDHLRVSANIAYTDAFFTDYPNAGCYTGQTAAQGCNVATQVADATGNPLPDAPKWIYSLAGLYDVPLTSRLNGFIGVNYYHRSAANFSAVGDPLLAVPAYGLLGASIGVEDRNGKWRFALSGKNLLDKAFCAFPYPASAAFFGAAAGLGGEVSNCAVSEAAFRTLNATLDVKF